MGLNPAQEKAVRHKDGPCMVLAGPGSGKTTVITRRAEYLIKEHKVNPDEILVITFSKAASKEMSERFRRLNEAYYPVTFGTFHGIYYGILKWAYRFTAENILSEEQKYQILRQIVEKMELDISDEKDFLQSIVGEISNIKNNRIPLEEYKALSCTETVFRKIVHSYEQERKKLRKVDFDDMLVLTYSLFQSRPDILKLWQSKFKYILIDEFQDINSVQYDVIRMLAEPENNIFIVGDDDQSIYRFRGSRPEIMLGFKKEFPNAEEILLDINYRSTKAVVNGAARVIRHNTARYQKKIMTLNEQGSPIRIRELKDPIAESKYIVEEIQSLKQKGVSPSEIAVLYRTNLEARTLAETCMEYSLSFQMKEHLPNLYEHFISQNILTYMKMAMGDRSRKSFLEIMNRPNRYFTRESMQMKEISFLELRKFYRSKGWMQDRIDQFELDLRMLGRMAPFAAIQYIRKQIGYDEFLVEYAKKRRINLEDLQDILRTLEERARQFQTAEEWFAHIEEYSEQMKEQAGQQKDNPEAVAFMTMHGAKGLEFAYVFLIAANEDVTPYKKAESKEELEEERRMFYVAMTRAKKGLTITYTKERNGKKKKQSRFVAELLQR